MASLKNLQPYDNGLVYEEALWIYRIRGDDEGKLTNEDLSNLKDDDLSKVDKIAEIFMIKTDLFNFETPLCKAFNEFNYLLKVDRVSLLYDIPEEALKQKDIYEGSWGNATQEVMNFYAWLRRCFDNFHELDYELLIKIEEYWIFSNARTDKGETIGDEPGLVRAEDDDIGY
ncbi:hypothetical protein Tco_0002575 [Tanacetum coccineum]